MREKIAQFRNRINDPDLQKSVKNAVEYRRRMKVPDEKIYAFLLENFGHTAGLTNEDISEMNTANSSAELLSDPGESDSLNSATQADTDLNSAEPFSGKFNFGTTHQFGSLNLVFSAESIPIDRLNSAFQAESIKDDGLNSALAHHDGLNSSWQPETKTPTAAEVAAEIKRMQKLQVSQIGLEGVVIEMPLPQINRTQNNAEPKIEEPARKIYRVRPPKKVEKKKIVAVRKKPDPLAKTLFCTLALLALIGVMAYYLMSATQALYGIMASAILVAIPIAVVFFVDAVGLRYLALTVFLGADLWSLKALQVREVAEVHSVALASNPEYQRLLGEYESGTTERNLINAGTHISARNRAANDVTRISKRMTEIESIAKPQSGVTAEVTRTWSTLAIRALFLFAIALLSHQLLRYVKVLDFDLILKKFFAKTA